MLGNLILASLVIAVASPMAWVAFHNIKTGTYPRQKASGPGMMPPSGPDIGGTGPL